MNEPKSDDDVLMQMIQDLSHWHDKLNERQANLTLIGLGDSPLIAELQAAKDKLLSKMDEILDGLRAR